MTGSMIDLLRDGLRADPHAPLLIDAEPAGASIVTREAFWRRIESLRRELAAKNVGAGDAIGVWLPNWSDSLVWQFAAVSLGAHIVGINTRYNVEEVSNALDLARPKVIAIAHDFVGLDLGNRLSLAVRASSAPAPSIAVLTGPHKPAASRDVVGRYDVGAGAWTPAPTPDGDWSNVHLEDDPAALAVAFTTSGSTGRSKLAAHSVGAVASHALACRDAGGWSEDSVSVIALPLTGVFSFVPAMAAIAAGGRCLLEPVFDAEAIVADMGAFGATHLAAADDIVGRIIDSIREKPESLASWKRLFIADFNGGSEDLARWAETHVGLVAAGVYGSSELFALAGFWPPSKPAPLRWKSGGIPVSASMAVRTADPDTGTILAFGELGELQFKGPNVVDAYLGQPDRLAAAMTADGWFRSGDLGIVRDNGGFDYVCRMGDALRLKGFLVEPAEIEQRLQQHAAVDVSKVVGASGADGNSVAIGFVVLKAGSMAEPAELVTWCAASLARYKVPSAVHILDEMPVTSGVNGTKIKATVLRDMAKKLLEA